MHDTIPSSVRPLAALGAVGAAATAVSGIVVQAVVLPSSTVSDQQWSYPWSADAVVPVSIAYAVFHVFVVAGIVGLGRSGLAGSSRPARAGTLLAVVGTLLLIAGEIATVPIRDVRLDDTSAGVVGAIFGFGSLVSAIGFVLLGVTTLRAGRWHGWQRWTPLATGVATTAVVGLALTPALPAGVAAYGLCLLATNVALLTTPADAPVTATLTSTRARVA